MSKSPNDNDTKRLLLDRARFTVTATVHSTPRTIKRICYADTVEHARAKIKRELENQGYVVTDIQAEPFDETKGGG
jgi:hypothetical protein